MLTLWAASATIRARAICGAPRGRSLEAGGFPRDYDGLRALPGIGDYTAAAIASIAFALPHAVLDGNVMRVVARMENDACGYRRRTHARTVSRDRAIVAGREEVPAHSIKR